MEQTIPLDYAGDFRAQAVLVSTEFCGTEGIHSLPHDLTQLGTSLCLPATDNPGFEMQSVRRSVIMGFVTMGALLLCGGALIIAALKGRFVTPIGLFRIPSWVGALLAVAGWVMMCTSVNREHWVFRRRIISRGVDQSPFPVSEGSVILRIEDPATIRRLKLVIDDAAISWCDASRGVMQLEGFAYRYVIWAKDILSLNNLDSRYVEVKFSVGGSNQVLALAVAMNGAAIELKRQLSFGMSARAVGPPLERVFGLPIPWPGT